MKLPRKEKTAYHKRSKKNLLRLYCGILRELAPLSGDVDWDRSFTDMLLILARTAHHMKKRHINAQINGILTFVKQQMDLPDEKKLPLLMNLGFNDCIHKCIIDATTDYDKASWVISDLDWKSEVEKHEFLMRSTSGFNPEFYAIIRIAASKYVKDHTIHIPSTPYEDTPYTE